MTNSPVANYDSSAPNAKSSFEHSQSGMDQNATAVDTLANQPPTPTRLRDRCAGEDDSTALEREYQEGIRKARGGAQPTVGCHWTAQLTALDDKSIASAMAPLSQSVRASGRTHPGAAV